jgi:AcrR family transcriptional regulator
MPLATTAPRHPPLRRRDQQKEQTRLDLSLAAFKLARAEGLANVRVPQIAWAVGVSPRTFNNYFQSKEAAIVFPTTLRAGRMADNLVGRPTDEPLADALIESVTDLYGPEEQDGLPSGWLDGFRALVAAEPALHGEYLKAMSAGERGLAEAIASRIGAAAHDLGPLVLAAVVTASERAAVLHWARQATKSSPLVDVVRAAIDMAIRGPAANLSRPPQT